MQTSAGQWRGEAKLLSPQYKHFLQLAIKQRVVLAEVAIRARQNYHACSQDLHHLRILKEISLAHHGVAGLDDAPVLCHRTKLW